MRTRSTLEIFVLALAISGCQLMLAFDHGERIVIIGDDGGTGASGDDVDGQRPSPSGRFCATPVANRLWCDDFEDPLPGPFATPLPNGYALAPSPMGGQWLTIDASAGAQAPIGRFPVKELLVNAVVACTPESGAPGVAAAPLLRIDCGGAMMAVACGNFGSGVELRFIREPDADGGTPLQNAIIGPAATPVVVHIAVSPSGFVGWVGDDMAHVASTPGNGNDASSCPVVLGAPVKAPLHVAMDDVEIVALAQ